MDTDAMMSAVREWLSLQHPGFVPGTLVVRGLDGREIIQTFPFASPPRPQREPDSDASTENGDLHPCEQAILTLIEEKGERMKRNLVVRELRGRFGEGTITKKLASMVRDGLLSHPREEDEYGYGYGLPWWQTRENTGVPDVPGTSG